MLACEITGHSDTDPNVVDFMEDFLKHKLRREVIPVRNVAGFAGNRIASPDVAEEIISSGKADAVALGRPLLRDPEYPKKAAEGRPEEISECIACFGCQGLVMRGKRVHCVQLHGDA